MIATKPQCLILSGLPASDKTTTAKAWIAEDPDGRVRINYDDLRVGMFGENWIFNRKQEAQMKDHAHDIADKAINAGLSVVIDNTNLTQRTRDSWAHFARSRGAEVIYDERNTPVAECVRRDKLRKGRARVGQAVINRMALFHGFEDWSEVTGRFVIFDLDGTLADCEHRRHFIAEKPKDWLQFFKHCDQDPPVTSIVNLASIFHKAGYTLLAVSGRPVDLCGVATEDWLERHVPVPFYRLFMRNGGDHRPDTDVKLEIADLLPLNRIDFVVDDRANVVRAWRSRGLTVLQCAEGAF